MTKNLDQRKLREYLPFLYSIFPIIRLFLIAMTFMSATTFDCVNQKKREIIISDKNQFAQDKPIRQHIPFIQKIIFPIATRIKNE